MSSTRSRIKNGSSAMSRVERNRMTWRKPLPPKENPLGIPREVMRTLANEQLSGDPVAFNLRLQQLLALHELTKRGG
jgi:hypothetical protein